MDLKSISQGANFHPIPIFSESSEDPVCRLSGVLLDVLHEGMF